MGAHLVFGDESIFRARGFQTTAWAAPRQNVVVEDRTDHQPCQAVCAAVCACHGVLTYAVEEYSFNRWKFIDFLRQLRGDAGDETIYLFLDQASYHKEQSEVATEFEKLDIVPVWNVPYRFEFNAGIERWWAVQKSALDHCSSRRCWWTSQEEAPLLSKMPSWKSLETPPKPP